MDGNWTGHKTKALREALRLEWEPFAKRVGVHERTIENWESGSVRKIRPKNQEALDALYGTLPRDVIARFEYLLRHQKDSPGVPWPASGQAEEETVAYMADYSRRHFGQAVAAVAALGAAQFQPGVAAAAERFLTPRSAAIGVRDVEAARTHIALQREDVYKTGVGPVMIATSEAALGTLEAGPFHDGVQALALTVAAEVADQLVQYYLDHQRVPAAIQAANRVIELGLTAETSDGVDLAVHGYCSSAKILESAGSEQAIEVVRAGQRIIDAVPQMVSPLTRGYFAATRARCEASRGNTVGATTALAESQHHYEQADARVTPWTEFFVNRAGQRADNADVLALLAKGDPRFAPRAADEYEAALAAYAPDQALVRAIDGLALANLLTSTGNPDSALRAVRTALGERATSGIASRRLDSKIAELRTLTRDRPGFEPVHGVLAKAG